jgi:hypothetical protein
MNDRSEDVEPRGTCAHAHKPAWWSDGLETSWGKAKMEATRDFEQVIEGERRLARARSTPPAVPGPVATAPVGAHAEVCS